jgi:hypothetical protein
MDDLVNISDTRKTILVSSTSILKQEMERQGTVAAEPGSGCIFMGIEIKNDWRIPDGVYATVPYGGNLAHPDTQIGSISPEYQDAARGFATALSMWRMSGPE